MLRLESFGVPESISILAFSVVHSLGWALLHFVWQGLLLAVLTASILFFLKRASAHLKYLVQCVALGMMASCPIWNLCLITIQQAGHSNSRFDTNGLAGAKSNSALTTYAIYQTPATSSAFEQDIALATSSINVGTAAKNAAGVVPETAVSLGSMNTRKPWNVNLVNALSPKMSWFVGGWLLGVFVLLLRLLGGWRIANRLRTSSVIPASKVWQGKLKTLATGMRISQNVQLLESTLIEVPTVIGWLRPVILFPVSILTSLTLEAVLAHELAHIRRHDYLVNLVQTVIEILLFYHPAVWWLSRRLRSEREHCCDDVAMRVCNDRMTYVLALTAMEELRTSSGLMLAASGGSLVSRVRRIVNADSNQRELRSRDRWPVALLTLTCLSAVLLFSVKSSHSALNDVDQDASVANSVANTPRDIENGIVRVLEVRGKVELPDGSPAEGAEILAVRIRPSVSLDARVETKTDPDGKFVLRLTGAAGQNSEWRLLAVHGQNGGRLEDAILMGSASETQKESPIKAVEPKTIRLMPGRTISGRVLSKMTRKPIANARVYSGRGQILRTDDQGRFELRGVPADVEKLLVESPGMVATQADIDVTERTEATIDIFVSVAGKLKGQVLLKDGRPLPNATISRSTSYIFFEPVFTRTTDADGRFSFDVFPTNILQYPLSIKSPGFQDAAFEMFAIRGEDQATEIILPAEVIPPPEPGGGSSGLINMLASSPKPSLGLIKGRVVDNDGNPVRNFVVSLISATPNGVNDMGSYSLYNRHYSEDDGRFVIGRLDADKRYCVAVTALDNSLAIVEPIYARTTEQITDADEAEFQLQPPINRKIRVVDKDTNDPLSDVMVGLANSRINRITSRELFSWDFRLSRAKAEWTSEAGVAEFSVAADDDSIIFIEHKGFARRHLYLNGRGDTAVPEASGTIELPLDKEARVRIQIPVTADRPSAEFNAQIESDLSGSFGSLSKRSGKIQIVQMSCISPGKNKLTITQTNSKEPWTALVVQDIVLEPGDNELTIELPPSDQ